MAKIKLKNTEQLLSKGQKQPKLPLKRVQEISDSLSKSGYNKIAASVSERIYPANELKELTKSGWRDVDESKRLKSLVNKSTKKEIDMPTASKRVVAAFAIKRK